LPTTGSAETAPVAATAVLAAARPTGPTTPRPTRFAWAESAILICFCVDVVHEFLLG
jgi:hypothetical protein